MSLIARSFWLQDTLLLNEDENLAEHGINGEGAVEIELHLKVRDGVGVVNIVDVSKPTADFASVTRSHSDYGDESVRWVLRQDFESERQYVRQLRRVER